MSSKTGESTDETDATAAEPAADKTLIATDGSRHAHDATGEFFSVGTPLHAVRAGYISRRADDLLYEACLAGRYAHIIAPDRSGKSSLVSATAARLDAHGIKVAVLDLSQIGIAAEDEGRWYYNVAYRLQRQLRIRYDLQTWWQDKSMLSNRQRLSEFYAEVILQNVRESIVVFVDEIQNTGKLAFADHVLASIRSAHNARATDPDFTRLTFVLLGECDPLSLVNESELSPFVATQPIPLDDFSRTDLNLFATELNLDSSKAQAALDRIFYWTDGQPYLSQKLARAVARETDVDDPADSVDRIVARQFSGRAAVHNEPHLSHIHKELVANSGNQDALLSLYGRLRKGVNVAADLGSAEQRRLMAVGLLVVDNDGELRVRNRMYEQVFTTRWANDNLRARWRVPLLAAAVIVVAVFLPFAYTQWLPKGYVDVLASTDTDLVTATSTWRNLRSFPGHSKSADNVYRNYLAERALLAGNATEVEALSAAAANLPDAGRFPAELQASFWDRRAAASMREERRDAALLASLAALHVTTPERRSRSASLVADDYASLLATAVTTPGSRVAFDAEHMIVSTFDAADVSQWSLTTDGTVSRVDWQIKALNVSPLVRRIIVDQPGNVRRLGLTINVAHPRLSDLRIKLIAPSGRAVEVQLEAESSSSSDEIRIPSAGLSAMVGEALAGTWSLSLRDESTGVGGHLVGWTLTLNSQVLVESFERGMGLPDPLEELAADYWVSDDGRYAVARTPQSDSARIWDLAFATPIATLAVGNQDTIVGLDSNAERLVTSTLDAVHIWDVGSGLRLETLEIGSASNTARFLPGGDRIIVQELGDSESRLQIWEVASATRLAETTITGAPALVAIDAAGGRAAVADYDRAVRIWDLANGEVVAQIDLPLQPDSVQMDASGRRLAVTYANAGFAVWDVAELPRRLVERLAPGNWAVEFDAEGVRFAAGNPAAGFAVHDAVTGRQLQSELAIGADDGIAFSRDGKVLMSNSSDGRLRYWKLADAPFPAAIDLQAHPVWPASADALVVALPGGEQLAIADKEGHLHFVDSNKAANGDATEELSFLGHTAAVVAVTPSADGTLVATVAADNSVRLWDAATALPREFIANVAGVGAAELAFSQDATRLAIRLGATVTILDTESGVSQGQWQLASSAAKLAFASDDTIYVGMGSGALLRYQADSQGSWVAQQLWSVDNPIRHLRASPRGRYLVIVDEINEARLINLVSGAIGEQTLKLPGDVADVVFAASESRLVIQTARWAHRVSASPHGLHYLNSAFIPAPLPGSGIVFGKPDIRSSQVASHAYLARAEAGGPHLHRIDFASPSDAGLLGNKDELLADWSKRLNTPVPE